MKYTEEDKEQVIFLASKGVSDSVIAKRLGVGYHFAQVTSTKYWKDKMSNKK